MIKLYPISLFLVLFAFCSQDSPNNKIGFTALLEYDKTRHFDNTSLTSPRYFRPVKIDLFYPTAFGTGNKLTYGHFLDQYEKRMDYNVSDDSCRKVSMMIVNLFGEYLKMDSPSKILQYPVTSLAELPYPQKKLPLIVYAAGMNGSTWENVLLFESLAREGFVIASVSSVGKFPGFMSEVTDVEEQVNDILYVLNRLKKLEFIDTTKIGIFSWSMGGTAAVKAAMSTKDIRCMLSFDGTETHYYGRDKKWDSMFNKIITIPPYNPSTFTIPYLYLSSDRSGQHDSIYNFSQHIASRDNYYLQFVGGIHEDFCSLPAIAKKVQPNLQGIHETYHSNINSITSFFFKKYLGAEKGDVRSYISTLRLSDTSKYIVNGVGKQ